MGRGRALKQDVPYFVAGIPLGLGGGLFVGWWFVLGAAALLVVVFGVLAARRTRETERRDLKPG